MNDKIESTLLISVLAATAGFVAIFVGGMYCI